MTDGLQYVYIKDIKPAQKNLNVIFIILEIGMSVFIFNL